MWGAWFDDGDMEARVCLVCGEADLRVPSHGTEAPETVTETEDEITETESETAPDVNINVSVNAGCESSVAGGTAIISVIVVAACTFIRKKKDD